MITDNMKTIEQGGQKLAWKWKFYVLLHIPAEPRPEQSSSLDTQPSLTYKINLHIIAKLSPKLQMTVTMA